MIPQRVPAGVEHTYYTYGLRYLGDRVHGEPWKQFWRRYQEAGGDGFYAACRIPYLEPAYRAALVGGRPFDRDGCRVAEQLQPEIMQLKTNYRDLALAARKAEVLSRVIDELGR
jgi:perosamine synthetase